MTGATGVNTDRLDDLLGRMLLLGMFTWIVTTKALTLMAAFAAQSRSPYWALSALSQVMSLLFVASILWMTLRRLPPRTSARGIEPRLTAIAGTFLLLLLVYLPFGDAGPVVTVSAMVLITVGSAVSIYCVRYLGRSFSIMASARELVSSGPYGIVRHPLYLAEAITVTGVILAFWSPLAVAIGLLQMAFQVRRMFNEEAVLRAAFPEYEAYAARVPMIIPRLGGPRVAVSER